MPDNSDTIALPSLHPLLDSVAYKSIPFGSRIVCGMRAGKPISGAENTAASGTRLARREAA